MDDTAAEGPRCTSCTRALWDGELTHQGCGVCLRRTDDNLAALAGPRGLYAQLATALTPGSNGGDGGRVSGSRHAPLPIRLEALSLAARGGVVTVLQTWLADWHELLSFTYPRAEGGLQQQCDQAVTRLRANLPWAAEHHPAWAEFAGEVRQLATACKRQATGEKPERQIAVVCRCGSILRFTLSTDGRRCTCGQQYGWAELRQLPLAERSAA